MGLVLVDSSVWIEQIRSKGVLERHVDFASIVTCGPVVQEVLQGILDGKVYETMRDTFIEMPKVEDPLSFETFLEAAKTYRTLRSKGFTIRSPNDCLIAACAIRNNVQLLHADRDFDVIARFTMLQAVSLSG